MDEREAQPKGDKGQLQPSAHVAIPEASETKHEGSLEPLIRSEDKPGLSMEFPVVASRFPDPFSSSEPEKSLTDISIQDNNLSDKAQIGTHRPVNSTPVSSAIIAVKVARAQGIVFRIN